MEPTRSRGVPAQEFFAAEIPGGTMTDAHVATRIAYSTIHRAKRGESIHHGTAAELERWSRELGAELFISAAATLGLTTDLAPTGS